MNRSERQISTVVGTIRNSRVAALVPCYAEHTHVAPAWLHIRVYGADLCCNDASTYDSSLYTVETFWASSGVTL